MLAGNLQGLRTLLLDSGTLSNTLYQAELQFEFDYLDSVLKKLKPIIYFKQANGALTLESRLLFNRLAAVSAGINRLVTVDISNALGVSSGFNSEDGD